MRTILIFGIPQKSGGCNPFQQPEYAYAFVYISGLEYTYAFAYVPGQKQSMQVDQNAFLYWFAIFAFFSQILVPEKKQQQNEQKTN